MFEDVPETYCMADPDPDGPISVRNLGLGLKT